MKTNKTVPGTGEVQAYIAAITDPLRRADCQTLIKLMQQVTGQPACMWGTSIVGFGRYAYRYASGRSGESCALGFSSRKGDISIYLVEAAPEQAQLLARLGKHRTGKACLYVASLADIDLKVLADVMAASYGQVCRVHAVPVAQGNEGAGRSKPAA